MTDPSTEQVTRPIRESEEHAYRATAILELCGEDDPAVDELPQSERTALAAVHAQLAQAAALASMAQSNALLIEEMRELNDAVRSFGQQLLAAGQPQ